MRIGVSRSAEMTDTVIEAAISSAVKAVAVVRKAAVACAAPTVRV